MSMPRVYLEINGYNNHVEKIVFGGYNTSNLREVFFNDEKTDFECMASYIGEFFLMYENDSPRYKCMLLTIDESKSGISRLVYEIVSDLHTLKSKNL